MFRSAPFSWTQEASRHLTFSFLSLAGCEECNNAHSSVCPKHGPLHPIPNRPVLTRARASLPLVLYIDRFLGGVFSKRRIPKRTQFGPVEGPLVRGSELKDCYIHLKVTRAFSHCACSVKTVQQELIFYQVIPANC